MSTHILSAKDIKREKHIIDAQDQILGRLSSKVAMLLMGKHKANYVPYLDTGDLVIVTNAEKIKVTGKKPAQKIYTRHSGYPGGLKQETFAKLMEKDSRKIIEHAVRGMLPKTKLGKMMIKKLTVLKGSTND